MKKVKMVLIPIAVCFIIFVLLFALYKIMIIKHQEQILEQNLESFKSNVLNLKDGDVVTLQELTDFDWDEVYDFEDGFFIRQRYEEYVGKQPAVNFYTDATIGASNILFLKDGKAVCYIYGRFDKFYLRMKLNSGEYVGENVRRCTNDDVVNLKLEINKIDERQLQLEGF
jgi:hypothetical protein